MVDTGEAKERDDAHGDSQAAPRHDPGHGEAEGDIIPESALQDRVLQILTVLALVGLIWLMYSFKELPLASVEPERKPVGEVVPPPPPAEPSVSGK